MHGNATITTATTPDETLYIYVQLRPGTQSVRKCIAHLNRLLDQHPAADVHAAGLEHGTETVNLTIGVNPGPADQIAKFGEQAVAAFEFVKAVFSDMFDHLPQYTQAPSDDARLMAAKIPGLIGTAQDTPVAMAV